MSIAVEFKKYYVDSDLGLFDHIFDNEDNIELIKQHLDAFGQNAEIKDHPWTDDEGRECDSIDLIFADGTECNIHEMDIEASLR